MSVKDAFSSSVNMPELPEKDLPSSYPAAREGAAGVAAPYAKFTARYASFTVDADGNARLEEIMNDCLAGKKILAEEKWHFTKEGDAIVVIKYLIPIDSAGQAQAEEIAGRRRQRKALERKEE